MPIYEYECKKCGASFEHLAASMNHADEAVQCPSCHARQTKRKISVFAVAAADAGGASAEAAPGGMCGCGRMKGSCGGRA
jgi:putative FmdB family regulatory protein